ncbi:MAG: hypothetical protein ACLTDR_15370 [Adlercreutzia equolifaciens]
MADPKCDEDCPSAILAGVGVALKLVQVLGGRLGYPHLWRRLHRLRHAWARWPTSCPCATRTARSCPTASPHEQRTRAPASRALLATSGRGRQAVSRHEPQRSPSFRA